MNKFFLFAIIVALSIFFFMYTSSKKTVQYDTIVVGAGLAGLSAGLELQKNNKSFVIFEASNEVFGRVKTLFGFADFPIEIGAEIVHGNNNEFYFLVKEFIKSHNYSFVENNYDQLFWVPEKKALLNEDEIGKSPSMKAELDAILDFDETIYEFDEESDISVKDYKRNYLENNRFSDVFSTLSSHDKGAGAEEVGMFGLQEDADNWGLPDDPPYDEFLMKRGNYHDLFSIYYDTILKSVQRNSVVKHVNYENDYVEVTLENGQTITCKNVIITVSLGVLKKGLISFSPALPKEKLEAINGLGFSGGIKLLIKLKKSFWDESALYIFTNAQGVDPIYWVTSAGGRSEKDFVLTGFFMGSEAQKYEFKQKELIERVKEQLATLFNISKETLEENVVNVFVQNWGEQPYVLGGYSFIKLDQAYKGHRKNLVKSVDEKLFFAGEATSINFSSTMQGAMITGKEAAQNSCKK